MALFFGQAFFWCTSATWTPQTCTESALVVHAPRTWASNCRAPCSPPWLCTAPCGYIGSWFAHSGTQEGTGREVFQFGQPLWRTRARAAWLRHLFSHERRTHDAQPPPRGQKVRVRRVWLVGEEIGQEILNMRRIVCGPPAEIFSFWPDHFRGTLRPVFFCLPPGGFHSPTFRTCSWLGVQTFSRLKDRALRAGRWPCTCCFRRLLCLPAA